MGGHGADSLTLNPGREGESGTEEGEGGHTGGRNAGRGDSEWVEDERGAEGRECGAHQGFPEQGQTREQSVEVLLARRDNLYEGVLARVA